MTRIVTTNKLTHIAVAVPLEEAIYFANTCRSVAIVCASKYTSLAQEVSSQLRASHEPNFTTFQVRPHLGKSLIPAEKVVISSDHSLDYASPGLAIFTSGTSGPPKCAVRRRAFLDMMAHGIAQLYDLSEGDVVLHTLPVHHATGIGISFMPFLLAGATIEFQSSGFNPAQIWERWRKGGLTVFSGVPTMYLRLMKHYEEVLSQRADVSEYASAAGAFRLMISGSAALPFSLQVRWQSLLQGKRILERYGATEFGSVFSVRPGDMNNPDVCFLTSLRRETRYADFN